MIPRSVPMISVLTPVLDQSPHLQQCLDSVTAQGGVAFEHVLVDRGSADSTKDVLASAPHVRWLRVAGAGEASALNEAAARSRGDILLWLDGRDWLEPDAFKVARAAFEADGNRQLVYGACRIVDETGVELRTKHPLPEMNFGLLLRWWNNPILPQQSSLFFSRKALDAVGGFREGLRSAVDYDLWLRLSCRYPFHSTAAILASSRERGDVPGENAGSAQIESHWQVALQFLDTLDEAHQSAFWMDYLIHCAATGAAPESWIVRHPAFARGKTWALLKLARFDEASRTWQPGGAGLAFAFGPNEVRHGGGATLPGPTIRVAGEDASGTDLTKVSQGSAFSRAIRDVLTRFRPTRLIETGTYLGTGTTAIIARGLADFELSGATFYSIEVNHKHHALARENLTRAGLADRVQLLLGLSVPSGMLPDVDAIQEALVTNLERNFSDVFVDHAPGERAALYHRETAAQGVPDDLLGRCLRSFDRRPDFVLLDSGGHIGLLEFQYLIDQLEGPCVVALDDVHHVKHRRSYEHIKADPRFEVLHESREKFGFCVARFSPRSVPAKPEVRRLLWIRPDAIGDAVLAASMLPHLATRFPHAQVHVLAQSLVAPLYERCPHVTGVITFERANLGDAGYVQELMQKVRALEADVVLCSVYSREPLADLAALASTASVRHAFEGDEVNMPAAKRALFKDAWTKTIPFVPGWKPELERHREFLADLGIVVDPLKPLVWTDADDEAKADQLYREHGLETHRTLVLAAGAQSAMRIYEGFAEALQPLLADGDWNVVALGSAAERDLHDTVLERLPGRHLNLCGRTALRECASLLRRARLLVGAESGLAHMACAVGTPQVVVLGGGHLGRFMPYSPLTSGVVLPLDCVRCDWACRHSRAHCVKDIHPGVVAQAIRNTLSRTASRPRVFVQSGGWSATSPTLRDCGDALDRTACEIIPASIE